MSFTFSQAIQKLSSAQLNPRGSYAIKKIVDALTKQMTVVREAYQKELVSQYPKKDEKGAVIPGELDVPEAKQVEFAKAQEDFGAREFTIDRNKLSFADLGNLTISAVELTLLEPIIAMPDEVVDSPAANVTSIR